MIVMRKLLFLFAITVIFISCSKTGSTVSFKDTTKPVVKVIAPVTAEHYNTGDPLCFKGTADDDGQITTVNLRIEKNGVTLPGSVFSYSPNGKYFYVDQKIIVTNEINGNCNLIFEAIDFAGNKGSINFSFSAN